MKYQVQKCFLSAFLLDVKLIGLILSEVTNIMPSFWLLTKREAFFGDHVCFLVSSWKLKRSSTATDSFFLWQNKAAVPRRRTKYSTHITSSLSFATVVLTRIGSPCTWVRQWKEEKEKCETSEIRGSFLDRSVIHAERQRWFGASQLMPKIGWLLCGPFGVSFFSF